MTDNLRTVSYFTVWGVIYGFLLGAFSGTAILPYFGTIYSVIWGTGIGFGCGLLSGIVAAVVRTVSFHRDTDLDRFRRRLALSMGLLNAIAAPIMLILTSDTILWGSQLSVDMRPWSTMSTFAASFWGALSAAYIASHYTHFIARLTAHREFDEGTLDLPETAREVYNAVNALARAGTRWIFAFGGLAGGVIYMMSIISNFRYSLTSMNLISLGGSFLIGGVLGVIATFIISLFVAFGNAAFITFLKRLIFNEYFPHLPPQWTRRILTASAFVFTLGISYTTLMFAPLLALIVSAFVYRSIALPTATFDKLKRKEKNVLALEDASEDDALLHDMTLTQANEQSS